LIFAAALRGTGKVQVVMLVRVLVFGLFFAPLAWSVSQFTFTGFFWRFIAIYATFYIADALMGMIYGAYIVRFSNRQEERERAQMVHPGKSK